MSEHKKRILGDGGVVGGDLITEQIKKIEETLTASRDFQKSSDADNNIQLSIMMFDDNQAVLNLYLDAAGEINEYGEKKIKVSPVLTTRADEVAERIYNCKEGLDLILIDNNFGGKLPEKERFYAAEVLDNLNNYEPELCDKNIVNSIKPRFLPRIVVTQTAYDSAVVEQLSVAGADKVVFGKGKVDNVISPEMKTAAQQLLGKLLQADEWDDLRQRACHRLWRDLLLFVEEKIRASKTSPNSAQNAQAAMAALMNQVREWMQKAGVADAVTFRVAERSADNGILMLRDVADKMPNFKWDESPLLKELAEQNLWNISRAEMITRHLTRNEAKSDPEHLTDGFGSHGIGVPLNCGHGFFGTIALTRPRQTPWPKDQAPRGTAKKPAPDKDTARFTVLEAEYLVRLAQRLALFYEQLLDATRLRRRQQGLLELAQSLATHLPQQQMIRAAIDFLHTEFHINSELAFIQENYDIAPGTGGKVVCCLLEHATGLVYCPDGARVGYDDGHAMQGIKKYDEPLTMEKEENIYVKAINEGETQYCTDSASVGQNFDRGLYPARAVMVEPLTIQGRSIGAIKVANKKPDFYGKSDSKLEDGTTLQDNLDLLRAVANILSQALHENRLLQFENALINLATSTGPNDEQKVMDNMAQALYAYIGPGILLWCEADSENQLHFAMGWCGEDREILKDSIKKDGIASLRRMSSDVIEKWAEGPKNEKTHLDVTFREYIKAGVGVDNYSEDKEVIVAEQDKNERNFGTKSQYSLVLLDQYKNMGKGEGHALGVLALLFNQKNAVSADQQAFLRNFGSFIGTYIASVRRNKQFFGEEKQRELAEFLLALSHQVRHTLKSNVNTLIFNIENELDGGEKVYTADPEKLLDRLKRWSGELSVTHLLPNDLSLTEISPAACWARACEGLKNKASTYVVNILPLVSSGMCICNQNILENALVILIDNALDALSDGVKDGDARIWAELVERDDVVLIDVYDSGPGFLPELKEKFAELGLSTKARGSGTGLYWCRRFLPLVNGKMELLTSSPQARVRLTLQRK